MYHTQCNSSTIPNIPLMADDDGTPLLLPSIDSIVEECVGDLGIGQLLQAMLVCFVWFFDAQQSFIAVFTDANPKSHRTNNHSTSCDFSSSNICELGRECWAWDSPPEFSIVSEWNLQCAPSFFSALPSSSFFLGCLLGGFSLATLADSSLGRKNTLLLSSLILFLSSLLTALSPNLWFYSAFRFLSGLGRANLGSCALVLSTELISKRWRSQVAASGFFAFTFGFLSLPLLAAYASSSWRSLYIWTSIPLLLYSFFLHFFVHESPRWLFVQGRKLEALTTLKSIASANQGISRISFSAISSLDVNDNNNNKDDASYFSAIKMLFSKKWCAQRVYAVMTIAVGSGMAYYGMPLALGNLGGNLYVSTTLNAVSELPATLFTMGMIGRLNRRGTLVGFTMASGICSVLSVIKGRGWEWERVRMGLELISFFSACTAVDVLLMFTIELFPTCVRNSAVSLVRQGLVIGGVLSPMLAVAGRKMAFLSYGVFGIVIASCGAFVACLPETKGRAICDTMDEEQNRITTLAATSS